MNTGVGREQVAGLAEAVNRAIAKGVAVCEPVPPQQIREAFRLAYEHGRSDQALESALAALAELK